MSDASCRMPNHSEIKCASAGEQAGRRSKGILPEQMPCGRRGRYTVRRASLVDKRQLAMNVRRAMRHARRACVGCEDHRRKWCYAPPRRGLAAVSGAPSMLGRESGKLS